MTDAPARPLILRVQLFPRRNVYKDNIDKVGRMNTSDS